jgi:hypothetical protein
LAGGLDKEEAAVDTAQIEERIRAIAKDTDGLIVKLDTLTGRIDTAKTNDNRELAEYYERQFAEASVEFMNGVETILDEWYALKGTERPPADQEVLPPEVLDEIHNAVVAIVQGGPPAQAQASVLAPRIENEKRAAAPEGLIEQSMPEIKRTLGKKGPGSKVDVTG